MRTSDTTATSSPAPGGPPPGRGAPAARTFDEVYRSQRLEVIRLAFLLVRSHATAEELAHDAFLRLHAHFDEVENPGGFLHTAVVRLCLTWLSRESKQRELLTRVDVVSSFEPTAIDEMWAALGLLPIERRTVLVLRYYADMSHADIAALVGCPVGTVRTRLHRGLADLRRALPAERHEGMDR